MVSARFFAAIMPTTEVEVRSDTMFEAPDIAGAQDVIAWFGYWPTFHDAEVLSISLDRLSGCRVSVHAFETTAEIDSSGHYVLAKHAVVTFCMEGFPRDESGISNTRIEFFNNQNVLSSASVNARPEVMNWY